MTQTFIQLGIMATLIFFVWLLSRGQEIMTRKSTKDRRNMDLYQAYNEQEDRTETMFDRRAK